MTTAFKHVLVLLNTVCCKSEWALELHIP